MDRIAIAGVSLHGTDVSGLELIRRPAPGAEDAFLRDLADALGASEVVFLADSGARSWRSKSFAPISIGRFGFSRLLFSLSGYANRSVSSPELSANFRVTCRKLLEHSNHFGFPRHLRTGSSARRFGDNPEPARPWHPYFR